jgi:type VI secretion system secreted protein VgrG
MSSPFDFEDFMATYTQANRPLRLTTPLGADALLLAKCTGTEAMSELFEFRLELLAEQPVSFDDLLGQAVTVTLEAAGSPRRYINGIVSELSQGPKVTAANGRTTFFRYQAVVVPQLWLLTRRFQSRIFQHQSVPDILKQVLKGEWQLDVTFAWVGGFHKRDRCVQYRETDFAFVSRLMEDEGIYYSFEHREDGHTLVVTNRRPRAPDLPEAGTLIYEAVQGGVRNEARVTAWEKTQQLRSCKYTLWDHSFELTGLHLEAGQSILDGL